MRIHRLVFVWNGFVPLDFCEYCPQWTKGKSGFRSLDFPLCLSESRTVPPASLATDPIPEKLRRIWGGREKWRLRRSQDEGRLSFA